METGGDNNFAQGAHLGIAPGENLHVHALGVIKDIFGHFGISYQPGLVVLLTMVSQRFQGCADVEETGVSVESDLDVSLDTGLVVKFTFDEEVLAFFLGRDIDLVADAFALDGDTLLGEIAVSGENFGDKFFEGVAGRTEAEESIDRKSTRLNSSH